MARSMVTGISSAYSFFATVFGIVFSGVLTWIIFVVVDKTVGMRVDARVEEEGLDIYEHGESAFNL